MKKIYMLFAALAFVGFGVLNAQTVLIDETFDDWDPTDAVGFVSGTYTSWNYTTPSGSAFELKNCRFKPNDDYIDLERDDKGGAIILPEIPSCSKVELDIRSGNNSSVTGDRFFYISTYDGETFTQISPDIPAIGRATLRDPGAAEYISDDALFATYTNTEEVVSSEPIRFAILNKTGNAGGNVRLENVRVWGGDGSVGIINNSAEAQIVIYTTPKNIKIGGDVVNVEVINLAGSVIKTSNVKGIQSISTSDLNNGVYIVKATDSKGLTKTEKVIIR